MKNIIAALLILAGGCRTLSPTPKRECATYRADDLDDIELRRIVVLPFYDECSADYDREPLERAFTAELEKATSANVVRLTRQEAAEIAPREVPRRTGRYGLDPVLNLAMRYNADAVLFGAVTAYRPYAPQVFGLRTELVSTSSGNVLWSVDARYDLRDGDAEAALKDAFSRRAARDHVASRWETAQLSPSTLAELVCSEAAATLTRR